MANTKFTRAVKKAKGMYKTGRYKTFADAVRAAYKKVPGGKKKTVKRSAAKRKPVRRVSAIKTKSAVHNDYNRPEVNISIGSLTSKLKAQYKAKMSTHLLRREMATRKTDKRREQRAIRELKNKLRRLS